MVDAADLKRRLGRMPAVVGRRLRSAWSTGVHFLAEGTEWVIDREGQTLARMLEDKVTVRLTDSPRGLRNQIVHFGSIWSFHSDFARTHPSNRTVLTWYHGHEGMGPQMQEAIAHFRQDVERLDAVVTACCEMRDRLAAWGTPPERLHLIPLGVDLDAFRPADAALRAERRRTLGIPEDAFVVGSFQKDGVGWGDGMEPKLIKGPDRLVEVLRRIGRERLHVLLLGPSRGYVKRGLTDAGIPYTHVQPPPKEVPAHYQALDAYVVTSREEGGPRSLPEAMACGVPLVTTRVGMATEMVENGTNGLLVDAKDEPGIVDGLAHGLRRIRDDAALTRRLSTGGRKTAVAYDERLLAHRYYQEVYRPLLERGPA